MSSSRGNGSVRGKRNSGEGPRTVLVRSTMALTQFTVDPYTPLVATRQLWVFFRSTSGDLHPFANGQRNNKPKKKKKLQPLADSLSSDPPATGVFSSWFHRFLVSLSHPCPSYICTASQSANTLINLQPHMRRGSLGCTGVTYTQTSYNCISAKW